MNTTAPGPPGADLEALIAQVEALVEQALVIVRTAAGGDLQAGFELAERLQERLEAFRAGALAVRDDLVFQIWQAEALSLGQLARRIGKHKSRADQITRAALARREGADDGGADGGAAGGLAACG